MGFPGGSVVKNLPAKCRRHRRCGFNPGWARSPGVGNSNPLLYSCLENSMDGGAWWATVDRVAKSDTTGRVWTLRHQQREDSEWTGRIPFISQG